MDRFVIFNKATGKRYGMESYGGYKEWNTERAAKAALTRLKNKYFNEFSRNDNAIRLGDLHSSSWIRGCYLRLLLRERANG